MSTKDGEEARRARQEDDGRPVVSVVISTRDRAGWLAECLRSLAEQDCVVPFEVVVIDNGSSDRTPQLLAEWTSEDPRFRCDREDRVGLSFGKNRGIALARGAMILFTDDDTIVDPSWISAYMGLFAKHGGDSSIGGGRIAPVPHDLGPWPRWLDEGALRDVGLLDHRSERILERGEYLWGANMAVPRIVFDRFGSWDEAVGNRGGDRDTFEDAEFQDRIRAEGVAIWFSPSAKIRHRVERDRITPRRLVANAFQRGRNEFCGAQVARWGVQPASWPRRRMVEGALDLGSKLIDWAFWTIAFGVSTDRRGFSRARRAAHAAGWSLESLRSGRPRSFGRIARAVWLVRTAAVRMTSDRPDDF